MTDTTPVGRPSALADRLILLAGGTSAAGIVAAGTLLGAGARVVIVGREAARLADAAAAASVDGRSPATAVCDLSDADDVAVLADTLHARDGHLDGILHLVGGWRGGGGLAGQTDAEWAFLETSLTALRHVSREFADDLGASPVGRLAIVSSTSVEKPLAGSANYTALKAAAETWTLAVDQGFAKTARDAGARRTAAAAIFRVSALAGVEQQLADAFVALFDRPAAEVGGTVTTLDGEPGPATGRGPRIRPTSRGRPAAPG